MVRVMAWLWLEDKPLSKPVVIQFTDAYMYHRASVSDEPKAHEPLSTIDDDLGHH